MRSGKSKETAHKEKESQECGTPEGRRRSDAFRQGAVSGEGCRQTKQMRTEKNCPTGLNIVVTFSGAFW